MEKDTMIVFRSTIRGKNKKGGDRSQLYLDQVNAQALVEAISAYLDNPRGVKIDIHTSEKTNSQTGNTFESTIAFVKAVSEGTANTGPRKFAPKGADLEAKAAALRAQTLKS